MKFYYVCFFMLFIILTNIQAEVLSVPEQYSLIQDAINEASNGDTVLIAQGSYYESINFLGKEITVTSNFIYSNDSGDIENTIIDGNNEVYHVVSFMNEETHNSKLIGLSIIGGNADGIEASGRGGGIYLSNYSAPVIDNCIISSNNASNCGGGIAVEALAGSATISNCKIFDNTALGGSGIYLGSMLEASIIENCEIYNNSAVDGAAIINLFTQSEFYNCSIYGNTAQERTTVILAYNGFKMDRCMIYNNNAESVDAFYLNFGSSSANPIIITNSTIVGNSSETSYTFHLAQNVKLAVVNSIIQNNVAKEIYADSSVVNGLVELAYCDIVSGQESIDLTENCEMSWDDSNISSDPFFVNSSSGDYSLLENSPCLDSGTDSYNFLGSNIILMNSDDYSGIAPDMGCFEYDNSLSEESEINPPDAILLSNYPNPFNPTTTISFSPDFCEHGGQNEIEIFNIKGQKVKTFSIISTEVERSYSVTWDGTDQQSNPIASGVYFAILKAGNEILASRKMLLLK